MALVGRLRRLRDGVEWRGGHEVVLVRAWGNDSVRVQAGLSEIAEGLPGALLEPSAGPDVEVMVDDRSAVVTNGAMAASVSVGGEITFTNSRTGALLLKEQAAHFWWPGARLFAATSNGYHRLEQRFVARESERLCGLGQHTHGLLDQKGCVVDLLQRNGEVSVPFVLSNLGYGFLWNSPAIGRVELGNTGTRWVADSARQLDYWVTAGTPSEVLKQYAEVTGKAPEFPAWASGFWQSKLRYMTQAELMAVAREYRRRELPLSVIVCDFFHAPHIGDYRFDPTDWPDPQAMVDELSSMGVKLMVSVWPSTTAVSRNFDVMRQNGYFIRNERGVEVGVTATDKGVDGTTYMQYYDATNPDARQFIWEQLREGYFRYGVRVFWLDASEPEVQPATPDNVLYQAGPGLEVGNMYPRENARMVWDGMRAEGEDEILSLNRSAWAGSQRYGAAVWSGDIRADFASLAEQIRAGLSMAISGIPWWTTDIGGFQGGDASDPEFRELMVRWFQFAVFCPITRLHGDREPRMEPGPAMTGGPNEVWSFGPEVYEILARQLGLREKLRPYVMAELAKTSRTGLPTMRPLLVDFPDDLPVWGIDDEYLFGDELLVAPVTRYGARNRNVYLPQGTEWRDVWTAEVRGGGASYEVGAPLMRIPVFERAGGPGAGIEWFS